jgi:hypothetical protein
LHYPPVLSTRLVAVSPRYLCEDEWVVIADLHRAGMSVRLIATEIGRSPSTVSRELARNAGPGIKDGGAVGADAVDGHGGLLGFDRIDYPTSGR